MRESARDKAIKLLATLIGTEASAEVMDAFIAAAREAWRTDVECYAAERQVYTSETGADGGPAGWPTP